MLGHKVSAVIFAAVIIGSATGAVAGEHQWARHVRHHSGYASLDYGRTPRTMFDGTWNLSANSVAGSCGSYGFRVNVINGRVVSPGVGGVSGRVTRWTPLGQVGHGAMDRPLTIRALYRILAGAARVLSGNTSASSFASPGAARSGSALSVRAISAARSAGCGSKPGIRCSSRPATLRNSRAWSPALVRLPKPVPWRRRSPSAMRYSSPCATRRWGGVPRRVQWQDRTRRLQRRCRGRRSNRRGGGAKRYRHHLAEISTRHATGTRVQHDELHDFCTRGEPARSEARDSDGRRRSRRPALG